MYYVLLDEVQLLGEFESVLSSFTMGTDADYTKNIQKANRKKWRRDELCIIVEFCEIFCYDINWEDGFYPV